MERSIPEGESLLQPEWLTTPSLIDDDFLKGIHQIRSLKAPRRERIDRFAILTKDHGRPSNESDSPSYARKLLRHFGVPSSEPVLGFFSPSLWPVVIFTDRRVVSYANSLESQRTPDFYQLYCDPSDLELAIGQADLSTDEPGLDLEIAIVCRSSRKFIPVYVLGQALPGYDEIGTSREYLASISEVMSLPEVMEREFGQLATFVASFKTAPSLPLEVAFSPRLIRSALDAERAAADFLISIGLRDVRVTSPGRDEGIDVVGQSVCVQVKAEVVLTGRPLIQQIHGVASLEQKTGVFFSLAGYTQEATTWANRADVALFQFDLQGVPEPVNAAARILIRQVASTGVVTTGIRQP